MSLEEYRRKRKFLSTPEPQGAAESTAENQWRFVVQKHAARNLHYDLRLELEGVLKSWAVPKGPSLDPNEKRLAIQVEDHPLEYVHFEGIIPQGEYGGGTVMVWDTGTWQPLEPDGYARGDLKFALDGHKLQGKWMLVHTGKRRGDPRHWLLFKERDEVARPAAEHDVLDAYPQSVLSGRSLEEIAADADAVWTSADTQRSNKSMREKRRQRELPAGKAERPAATKRKHGTKPHAQARKRKLAKKPKPALPTSVRVPPTGESWLHEIKYDGYRMLGVIEGGRARLISRNGNDWTEKLQRLSRLLSKLPSKLAVVDGEVVYMAADGKTSFQALQNTIGRGDDRALSYCLFDLLYLDGYDLSDVPLENRKQLLAELVAAADDAALIYCDHIRGEGQLVHEKAAQLGAEGIVSKRSGSAYHSGRTTDWLKTKCLQSAEFVVGGFTESTASRQALGALLVGHYGEDGQLVYDGRVGTGFSTQAQEMLMDLLQSREMEESPFCDLDRGNDRQLRWVTPELVVEVEYGGWTGDRRLRFPSYRGLREEILASDVRRVDEHEATEGESQRNAGGHSTASQTAQETALSELQDIRFTHPDRVMYPELGVTKLGLATYYAQVAEWMLPHVAERPLSLVRFPKGLGQPSFFQKQVPAGMPPAVRPLELTSPKGRVHKALTINDLSGLLALVQFSALEIHAWGARADRPDKPDRIIFDLDPDEAIPFARVVQAALELREILEALELTSFVKTTGGKGLHIAVPIRRNVDWLTAKRFAKAVAVFMSTQSPGRFTASSSKAVRHGKIYIDYLRNGFGATAIAPFSTRARASGSVAVPVGWDELDSLQSAEIFTIQNLSRRLQMLREDPWSDLGSVQQSITKRCLQQLEELLK